MHDAMFCIIFQITILLNMIFFKEPDLDGEFYPHWAIVLSWLIAMFPMFAMVAWFLFQYCYLDGGFGVSKSFLLYQWHYICLISKDLT